MKIRALNTACADSLASRRCCGVILLASLIASLTGCASQNPWASYAQSADQFQPGYVKLLLPPNSAAIRAGHVVLDNVAIPDKHIAPAVLPVRSRFVAESVVTPAVATLPSVYAEPAVQLATYQRDNAAEQLQRAMLPPTAEEPVTPRAQVGNSANEEVSPFSDRRPMEATSVAPQQPQPVPNADSGATNAVQQPFETTNVAPATGKPAVIRNDDLPPVQLHADDVDVRKVLEMLSRQGQLNILVSPGVSGNITANLENVQFNDALQAVLRLANLVSVPENDMIYVYTPEEYSSINTPEIASRIYHLRYLRASDIETMITPFLTVENGRMSVTPAADVGIQSDTDVVGGDSLAGAETIIVQDYESVLQRIDQIIAELDVEPMQVVIDAVIMEVVLDDSMALGINFGLINDAQTVLTVAGNGAALNAAGAFTPATLLNAGKVVKGFAQPNQGLKFGILEDNISVFIDALAERTETKILASPNVLVLNKQRAELIIGERIGFKTLTVTQTSTVENIQFLNVGTQLRIRPFVTPDGMIRMEVHPERSTGNVVDGIPRTRTNEITTNVMVPNGCTVVLAGLIEEEDIVSLDGVPGLSRLPYLGPFFRREVVTTRRKELVVTLTPRIVNASTILTGMGDVAEGVVDLKTHGLEYNSATQAVTLPKVPSTIQFGNRPKHVASQDSESSQR